MHLLLEGAALSSPNLNAVSQTVNITPENQALIKSGLDEAKQKAGIEPDIVAEGLAEAHKNVDQTQDPAIKTALPYHTKPHLDLFHQLKGSRLHRILMATFFTTQHLQLLRRILLGAALNQ